MNSLRILFSYSNKSLHDKLMNITKIVILLFLSLYLFGNFTPFYEAADAYLYAVNAINFANGEFIIANDLLEETGQTEFAGGLAKTIYNTAVPTEGIGLSAIGAIFYPIAGVYGLFYLSAIFALLLLIFSERIATYFFGHKIGFLTFLFLASNRFLINSSTTFQTESIFSLFFILGSFFLIIYLKEKQNHHLLLASTFFVCSTFVRLNGAIFFPAELIIIFSYFIVDLVRREKPNLSFSKTIEYHLKIISSKLLRKKTLKAAPFLLIPWIIFFIIFFGSNFYFFGDPLTNYNIEKYGYLNENIAKNYGISSLLMLESENLNNVKIFSMYLLPYPLSVIHSSDEYNLENILGNNWTGLLSIGLLLFILAISIYTKNKRLEIITFIIFIASTIWFFAAVRGEEDPLRNVGGRYMLPVYILSSMMFGFLIAKIFASISSFKKKYTKKITTGVLFSILVIFFIGAFYFSPTIFGTDKSFLQFKDPRIYAERYPLDIENLTPNDILLESGYVALDYDLIPFSPKTDTKKYYFEYNGEKSKRQPKLVFEIRSESISLLKETLGNGYNVYLLKNPIHYHAGNHEYLWNDPDFIIKDYSKTFCKVELRNNQTIEKSDRVCMRLN